MDLLITFVIPILVIIVAAILQTLLNCPFKVAGIIFVIAIIVALVLRWHYRFNCFGLGIYSISFYYSIYCL